ncbi:DUF6574 domain-containing protein [Virgibacillus ainsalahensis]
MLVCPKCNNEQESGKFCGVCGTELQASGQTVAPDAHQSVQQPQGNLAQDQAAAGAAPVQTQQTPSQSADAAQNVKNVLGDYWAYFLELIKNPTRAFNQTENHFVNGLITLGLYVIAFSLSIYFLLSSMYNATIGSFTDTSVPFFSVTFNMILLSVVAIALTFFSAFAMIKAAKHPISFKLLVSQYGALLIPFTALNVISMLGALIGSVILTTVPLGISGVLTLLFVPVLLVYEKASQVNKQGQNIYLSLATVVLITIGFFIISDVIVSSILDRLPSL